MSTFFYHLYRKLSREEARRILALMAAEAEKAEKKAGEAPPPKRGERKIFTPDEMHDYLDAIKKTGKVA